jgi:soluble lytic murein transglycosylase-like protein
MTIGGSSSFDPGPGGGPDTQPQKPKYDQAKVAALVKACIEKVNLLIANDPFLRDAIMANKLDNQSLNLTLAHAATESSFFVNAIGRQGELGLFQIKLATANSLGLGTFTKAQVLSPPLNTQLATMHLQSLVNSFGGDLGKALGAYKQGESGVRNNGLTVQSQEYADAILKCAQSLGK